MTHLRSGQIEIVGVKLPGRFDNLIARDAYRGVNPMNQLGRVLIKGIGPSHYGDVRFTPKSGHAHRRQQCLLMPIADMPTPKV
jgi:hypothetical protein